MKRTMKRVIAAAGAAAIAISAAVPASAASCTKTRRTSCNSNSNQYSTSCGNFGSIFGNNSSCLDFLKQYGINLGSTAQNPSTSCPGGNCTTTAQKPSTACPGGNCTTTAQKPSTACPGGNCTTTTQTPSLTCPNGNCTTTTQKPSSGSCPAANAVNAQKPSTACPGGNCTTTTQKPSTTCPGGVCDTDNNDSVLDYEKEVARLVNEIRKENGLSELKLNTELCAVARAKSQDMKDNNYFSHTSPTYGSPFDMMKTFGISYRTAGENIAMGYRTPEAVVNGWMNSEGHRANILNSSYKEIGMGYVASGNYWTQMFIG